MNLLGWVQAPEMPSEIHVEGILDRSIEKGTFGYWSGSKGFEKLSLEICV
jgi:hypothetical protein